jgi:seryl-tRNA synthetase
VKLVRPDTSYHELELLREDAERVLQKLGLPYHVLLMCSADLGFTQAKKYDLEVWAPGQQKWLEVSSISNFESYQARRMNIRFRPRSGGKPETLHTLNGSAIALPRIVAALLEQYQTPEGKVVVPKALHKYTGFELIG